MARHLIRRGHLVVVAGLAGLVLAGCGVASSPSALRGGHGRLTAVVVLSEDSVRAGTPIRGSLVLTNPTSTTLPAPRCRGNWLEMDIVIRNVGFHGPDGVVPCSSAVPLRPGVTRLHFLLTTTYGVCSRSSRVPAGNEPRCPDGVRPPLPDGIYLARTRLVALPRGMASPPPVRLVLLPSSALAVGATVRFRGESVTLVRIVSPSTPGVEDRFFNPAAGRGYHFVAGSHRHLVSVLLRITNTSAQPITGSAAGAVVILGTDNSWFVSLFRDSWACTLDRCRAFGSGTYRIAPGHSLTGSITFRVPDGVGIEAVEVHDTVIVNGQGRGLNLYAP